MTTDKTRIPYTKPSITELEVRYATDAAARERRLQPAQERRLESALAAVDINPT